MTTYAPDWACNRYLNDPGCIEVSVVPDGRVYSWHGGEIAGVVPQYFEEIMSADLPWRLRILGAVDTEWYLAHGHACITGSRLMLVTRVP